MLAQHRCAPQGASELRRCLNDLVSTVNEETFASKKDGAKTPVDAVELEFFSSNVRVLLVIATSPVFATQARCLGFLSRRMLRRWFEDLIVMATAL
jgi:hypothetical protein